MKTHETINHPTHKGASNGSIIITNILLDEKEQDKYIPYNIEWSSNVLPNNIDKNPHKQHQYKISNLSAGKYSYRIYNDTHTSEWLTLELTEPSALTIEKILVENLCTYPSIQLDISGGVPPYIISYNKKLTKSNDGKNITINVIDIPISSNLKIKDSLGATIESDDILLHNHVIRYNTISIKKPLVCDDHLQEYIISIEGTTGPYQIVLFPNNSDNCAPIYIDNNSSLIKTIDNIYYEYNLSSVLYPGAYKLEIFDHYGCLVHTEEIIAPNLEPLLAQITCHNNVDIANNFICPTEIIFDTILIPYNLIINDNNLLNWIKQLSYNDIVDIQIDTSNYKHKIRNYYIYPDILILGPDSSQWFFPIEISRGFNPNQDMDIYSKNIILKINDIKYSVILGFEEDMDSIKLIRGNIFTTSIHYAQFLENASLSFYQYYNTAYELIGQQNYLSTKIVSNEYLPGSVLSINMIYNTKCLRSFDKLSQNNVYFDTENLIEIANLNKSLRILNQYNDNIYIAAVNKQEYNGGYCIALNNNKITFNHRRYDSLTQTVKDIIVNNELFTGSSLYNLKSGTYIIKINNSFDYIRYINGLLYDEHYIAAKEFIEQQLNCTTNMIDFDYGDILINIFDNTINTSDTILNLPGIVENNASTLQVATTKAKTEHVVSTDSLYNNALDIIIPDSVQCNIIGPNDFRYSFQENTKFINLPPGVYIVTGQEESLKKQYLFNSTYQILVHKDKNFYMNIVFKSYYNSIIEK